MQRFSVRHTPPVRLPPPPRSPPRPPPLEHSVCGFCSILTCLYLDLVFIYNMHMEWAIIYASRTLVCVCMGNYWILYIDEDYNNNNNITKKQTTRVSQIAISRNTPRILAIGSHRISRRGANIKLYIYIYVFFIYIKHIDRKMLRRRSLEVECARVGWWAVFGKCQTSGRRVDTAREGRTKKNKCVWVQNPQQPPVVVQHIHNNHFLPLYEAGKRGGGVFEVIYKNSLSSHWNCFFFFIIKSLNQILSPETIFDFAELSYSFVNLKAD